MSLPAEFFAELQDPEHPYDINTFFWYFGTTQFSQNHSIANHLTVTESRNDPENAPTAVYLAGGPGTASIDASSNFPCTVNPDSNSTTINDFSWNTNVNMLYIDQPVGIGYSYTSITNGVVNLLTGVFEPLAEDAETPDLNLTTVQASISTPNPAFVVNNTETAAKMTWKFAQVWFQE